MDSVHSQLDGMDVVNETSFFSGFEILIQNIVRENNIKKSLIARKTLQADELEQDIAKKEEQIKLLTDRTAIVSERNDQLKQSNSLRQANIERLRQHLILLDEHESSLKRQLILKNLETQQRRESLENLRKKGAATLQEHTKQYFSMDVVNEIKRLRHVKNPVSSGNSLDSSSSMADITSSSISNSINLHQDDTTPCKDKVVSEVNSIASPSSVVDREELKVPKPIEKALETKIKPENEGACFERHVDEFPNEGIEIQNTDDVLHTSHCQGASSSVAQHILCSPAKTGLNMMTTTMEKMSSCKFVIPPAASKPSVATNIDMLPITSDAPNSPVSPTVIHPVPEPVLTPTESVKPVQENVQTPIQLKQLSDRPLPSQSAALNAMPTYVNSMPPIVHRQATPFSASHISICSETGNKERSNQSYQKEVGKDKRQLQQSQDAAPLERDEPREDTFFDSSNTTDNSIQIRECINNSKQDERDDHSPTFTCKYDEGNPFAMLFGTEQMETSKPASHENESFSFFGNMSDNGGCAEDNKTFGDIFGFGGGEEEEPTDSNVMARLFGSASLSGGDDDSTFQPLF